MKPIHLPENYSILSCCFFIVFSVVLVMLESITSINTKYEDTFYIAEWVITIIFSIEYILRIIVIKRPRHYIFSFYGIVDLLSTLPSYISFFLRRAEFAAHHQGTAPLTRFQDT